MLPAMSRHLAGHIAILVLLLLGSGTLRHLHLAQAHWHGSAADAATVAVCHGDCSTASCRPADRPAETDPEQHEPDDRRPCPTCQLLATLSTTPPPALPTLVLGQHESSTICLHAQRIHATELPGSISSRAPPRS
jgi:hypothetical protein